MKSEEQILKDGGPLAEQIIEKARHLLARAEDVSTVLSKDGEANWALTVLLTYEKPEVARQTFVDIGGHPFTTPAGKLYAFEGYRLLPVKGKDLDPNHWFTEDTLKRRVMFSDAGCTSAEMSIKQVLDAINTMAAGQSPAFLLLLKPLPRLDLTD